MAAYADPAYAADLEDIERKRKYADLLRQQSLTPTEGQMVSGHYVAPSWTQGLAKLFQGYTAGKTDTDANTRQKALADALLGKRKEWAGAMPAATTTQNLPADGMGPPQTITKQPTDQDYMAWAMKGMDIDPNMAAAGFKMADSIQTREDRNANVKAQREQRMQEIQMRLEDQKLAREDRASLSKELANMQAQSRRDLATITTSGASKPPSGYRFKPGGDLEQIPGGPADQKTQQRLEGGGTVDNVVASLRDMYSQLDEAGGITNPDKGVLDNVSAGVASSGVGQTFGKLLGTKNQSVRNTIAQQRPLLLQSIMKATGMSAKQMDSNVELKLYLATATDPTLDVSANKRALDMIEELYGSGSVGKAGTSNVDSLLEKYK